MRHPVRKLIGGSPTSSLKRRASAARDDSGLARPARRPSTGGRGCGAAAAAHARPPGRRTRGTSRAPRLGPREPGAQHGDHAAGRAAGRAPPPGPGSSLTISSASSGITGQSQSPSRHDQHARQRAQQPPADLAVQLVGAGQHHGRALGGVAPRAHAEAEALDQLGAARVEAAAHLAGIDRHLRRRPGVVGHRVVLGPADDRDVARAERHRLAGVGDDPRPAADHRHDGQRRLVLDAQRPRRIHARAQQEGLASPRAVEESGDRVHDPILDASHGFALLSHGPSHRERLG